MTSKELRQKYLDFFEKKGHKIIPSAPLFPQNDPTTLFTSSGMQPLVPYLLGEKHPEGKRLCDSQKSFRSADVEEVGDSRHTTFFEMLGNWSLGDYFKKEQLPWIFEFLIEAIKLDPKRLYATVFRGDEKIGVNKDNVAVEILQEVFKKYKVSNEVADLPEEKGMQSARIFYYPANKNWWSRSGAPEKMPVGEIGGPDSEIFFDLGKELKKHENSEFAEKLCHVNCDCGRFVEIGNSVFIEYKRTEKGFEKLKQRNVDFGGGLERITMAVQGVDSVFKTDLFVPIMTSIISILGDKPIGKVEIIADHLKAAAFLIADGVEPSNVERGYVLRRLIRRAMVTHFRFIGAGIDADFFKTPVESVINIYKDVYPNLAENRDKILDMIGRETKRFEKTLEKGLKEFEKKITVSIGEEEKYGQKPKEFKPVSSYSYIPGNIVFNLVTTYGFPLELIEEIAKERNLKIDKKVFEKLFEEHQELSRTASAGMFKGGLADSSEQTTKLHTAAHLMLAGLRKVLGDDVYQKGSNINAERL
ncbi:MAG: alanine--tRNA ligase-related protein, partial [Candidatus Staskawiczbacteria bacterium]|nr:alanine--tRNA ligase-related protein [Candidatus Staskawiczbacteria bacterium]